MIQELLGAVVEERRRKSNIPGSLVIDTSPTTSAISSPSQSAASSPSSAPESLRCPRCDSPNTKFCYYNNYNLTQPRHFCKTCRRYWTKGGALRNVPIGGGCRKTKAAASIIPGIANNKSGGCKPSRPMAGQLGTGGGIGLNLDLLPSLWGSCNMPHSAQLLALLRASQVQQNPNHHNNRSHNNLNSILMDQVKDEGAMVGAHILTDTSDPLGQVCSNDSSSSSSSLWKNNDGQYQYQNQNHLLGDTPTSSGIQELFQRLQSPANCGSNYNMQLFNHNVGSGSSSAASATMATTTTTTTTSASILEPLPLFSGGELGYWNPAPMSWADLPMPNGAFP